MKNKDEIVSCPVCGGEGIIELSPAREIAGQIIDAQYHTCKHCGGQGMMTQEQADKLTKSLNL